MAKQLLVLRLNYLTNSVSHPNIHYAAGHYVIRELAHDIIADVVTLYKE